MNLKSSELSVGAIEQLLPSKIPASPKEESGGGQVEFVDGPEFTAPEIPSFKNISPEEREELCTEEKFIAFAEEALIFGDDEQAKKIYEAWEKVRWTLPEMLGSIGKIEVKRDADNGKITIEGIEQYDFPFLVILASRFKSESDPQNAKKLAEKIDNISVKTENGKFKIEGEGSGAEDSIEDIAELIEQTQEWWKADVDKRFEEEFSSDSENLKIPKDFDHTAKVVLLELKKASEGDLEKETLQKRVEDTLRLLEIDKGDINKKAIDQIQSAIGESEQSGEFNVREFFSKSEIDIDSFSKSVTDLKNEKWTDERLRRWNLSYEAVCEEIEKFPIDTLPTGFGRLSIKPRRKFDSDKPGEDTYEMYVYMDISQAQKFYEVMERGKDIGLYEEGSEEMREINNCADNIKNLMRVKEEQKLWGFSPENFELKTRVYDEVMLKLQKNEKNERKCREIFAFKSTEGISGLVSNEVIKELAKLDPAVIDTLEVAMKHLDSEDGKIRPNGQGFNEMVELLSENPGEGKSILKETAEYSGKKLKGLRKAIEILKENEELKKRYPGFIPSLKIVNCVCNGYMKRGEIGKENLETIKEFYNNFDTDEFSGTYYTDKGVQNSMTFKDMAESLIPDAHVDYFVYGLLVEEFPEEFGKGELKKLTPESLLNALKKPVVSRLAKKSGYEEPPGDADSKSSVKFDAKTLFTDAFEKAEKHIFEDSDVKSVNNLKRLMRDSKFFIRILERNEEEGGGNATQPFFDFYSKRGNNDVRNYPGDAVRAIDALCAESKLFEWSASEEVLSFAKSRRPENFKKWCKSLNKAGIKLKAGVGEGTVSIDFIDSDGWTKGIEAISDELFRKGVEITIPGFKTDPHPLEFNFSLDEKGYIVFNSVTVEKN